MNPANWMIRLMLGIVLAGLLGCGPGESRRPPSYLTYTFDAPTRELIGLLAQDGEIPAYKDFDRNFKGLFVPESLLPYEPFVLGLSTESRIPTVLLLDAPWVQRYGVAGWLYELQNTRVFFPEELVPAVAEAFSVVLGKGPGHPGRKELVAVPTQIKGNILFYRQDLLKRYNLAPPGTWEELKAICRKILPQEKSLKYGLLLHPTYFLNDFYPIFWGFGGQIFEKSQFVLHRRGNTAACIAALKEIQGMQGPIIPGPKEIRQFETSGSTRRAFYQGEALFMINWNTRIKDLSDLIRQGKDKTPGSLTDIGQVGVTPIPCPAGKTRRYSNLGSFGWAVNRFSVTNPRVIEAVKKYIQLVADERFQLMAAETLGQVPSLKSALEKVKNKEVLQVYQDTFAAADMTIRPRPYGRKLNNVLEKYLQEVLYGQRTPEAAIQAALLELKDMAATAE